MTVNKYRGEIEAELDNKKWKLCLTLGALADLEHSLKVDNILKLIEKFEDNNISANDIIAIIGAGLRAGGQDVSDAEVASMHCHQGITGFATIAARLLQATFATDHGDL